MIIKEIHRGDIFFADLSPVVGSEQDGFRPVLVIQNDVGNNHSPTVIVAPITAVVVDPDHEILTEVILEKIDVGPPEG